MALDARVGDPSDSCSSAESNDGSADRSDAAAFSEPVCELSDGARATVVQRRTRHLVRGTIRRRRCDIEGPALRQEGAARNRTPAADPAAAGTVRSRGDPQHRSTGSHTHPCVAHQGLQRAPHRGDAAEDRSAGERDTRSSAGANDPARARPARDHARVFVSDSRDDHQRHARHPGRRPRPVRGAVECDHRVRHRRGGAGNGRSNATREGARRKRGVRLVSERTVRGEAPRANRRPDHGADSRRRRTRQAERRRACGRTSGCCSWPATRPR